MSGGMPGPSPTLAVPGIGGFFTTPLIDASFNEQVGRSTILTALGSAPTLGA